MRTPRVPFVSSPRRLAPVLAAAIWVQGCASLAPQEVPTPESGEPVVEQPIEVVPDSPDAPASRSADLEFLLAQELEAEGRIDEAVGAYERALRQDPESVYLLKRLAELSARRNRLPEALEYAERAYAVAPEEHGVALFLGTLYRLRRDPENAQRVLRGVNGDPIDGDAALLLYGVYTDAGRLEDARNVADWLVTSEPESVRGWFALADALERLGEPEAAENALRRALERHPGELTLYGALARGRRDRGDRDGEIQIYQEILAQQPDHHATLLALAEAQLAQEDVDAALETLLRVEELHPTDVRSSLRIAFIQLERGNVAEARPRFQRALIINPEAHEVAYFLGRTLRELGETEEALAAFGQVPEGHERYVESRAQIAAIYESQGDLGAAIDEVNRARAAADNRPLDLYLASLQARSGDVEGALEFLQELADESPDDVEVLYNIGVIHGEARQVDEALGAMHEVLEIDPNHAGALNYIGYTWAEQGVKLDEAEALINQALEIRPDDGFITDSLGWVYYMRARPLFEAGRREEALALLDLAQQKLLRAAELTGGDPVISEHLGDVFLLRGDAEGALRMFEEAVALEHRPAEQPHLLEKLERLREELGRN
ncbi:MAG: tetratricopeptide repeat protein [Myxococcota bacterium]|nr:tetratricopeptide repeat protein [Myxococcota bacterium]